MSFGAALSQLLDMGIPRGRARAALQRSKGDAMSAADRVFAGEFDEIPSDDEGSADDQPRPSPRGQAVSMDDDEEMFSENDDGHENFEGECIEVSNDPYAGIFFSKDRVEKVIEEIEEEATRKVRVDGAEYQVGVLGRGAWMSGCPEEGEQQHLFQLYYRLEEPLACPHGCGNMLARDHRDFFSLFPDFQTYTKHLKSVTHHQCAKCKLTACLACGEKVDPKAFRSESMFRPGGPTAELGRGVIEYDELLHCFEIQGILIGVGLHMIEPSFENSPVVGNASSSPPLKRRKSARVFSIVSASMGVPPPVSVGEGEQYNDPWSSIAKDGGAAKGTGYAGAAAEDRSGMKRAEQAQALADAKVSELLTQVRVYLPTLDRVSGARPSDHLVHPTALAHLRRRSGFATALLRNDSLLDMVNRRNIYEVLFDWLEVVSSHESLASMLGMPRMRPARVEMDPKDPHAKTVTYEGSASPRELLESCVIQAQAALKGLVATRKVQSGDEDEAEEGGNRMTRAEKSAKEEERSMQEKRDDENVHLEEFCNRIIKSAANIDKSLTKTKGADFMKRMRDSLPKLSSSEAEMDELSTKGVSEEAVIKIYEDWVSRARFQYCDMNQREGLSRSFEFHHAFNSKILSIANTDAPKRSLAIAKELAILTRNLPAAWHSSVFLRVDETRVDVIKAMIIGPEGTPYENGCFIFDIFLPLEYNMVSPQVMSMTTNGGKYRYNPNLYANGKVCLSLLGTWQGPGWIAGQSTLLQVLISIQSLIFCEEPYLNEPGWAQSAGTPPSKAYSANVRRMVLLDAMANNLRNPPRHFASEIKTHFRLKTTYIIQQLKRWKALDDGLDVAGDGYALPYPSWPTTTTSGSKETPFDKAAKGALKLLEELADAKTGAASKKVGLAVAPRSPKARSCKTTRHKK